MEKGTLTTASREVVRYVARTRKNRKPFNLVVKNLIRGEVDEDSRIVTHFPKDFNGTEMEARSKVMVESLKENIKIELTIAFKIEPT